MTKETPEEFLERLTQSIDTEGAYFAALLGNRYIPDPDDEDFPTARSYSPSRPTRDEYVMGERDDGSWRESCMEPTPCDSCVLRQYQARPIYVGGAAHGYFVDQGLQDSNTIRVPVFQTPRVYLREEISPVVEEGYRIEYYEKRFIRVVLESSILRSSNCALIIWVHSSLASDSQESFRRFYQFARRGE